MKINALHLDGFGKFTNFDLKLNDGFNILFGRNEYGKTTLMTFIKLMFYAEGSKSQSIMNNLRKKYRPANADRMAGSITFTHENQKYRLEREFGETPRQDIVNLVNLSTGVTKRMRNAVNIGEKFFGMTKEAFERSIFIGQLGNTPNTSEETEALTKRLVDLSTSGEENTSVVNAIANLEAAKETYFSKNGNTGKSDKLIIEIENLKLELDNAQQEELEILKHQKEKKQLQEEISRLNGKINKYNHLIDIKEKINQMNMLQEKVNMANNIGVTEKKIQVKRNKLTNNGFMLNYKFIEEVKKKLDTIGLLTNSLEKAHKYAHAIEQDSTSLEEQLEKYDTSSINEASQKILKNIDNAQKILKQKENEYNECLRQFYEAKAELLVKGNTAAGTNVVNKQEKTSNPGAIFLFIISILIFIGGIGLGVIIGPVYFLVALVGVIITAVTMPKLKSSPKSGELAVTNIQQDDKFNGLNAETVRYNKLDEKRQAIQDEVRKLNDYVDNQKIKLKDLEQEKHRLEIDFTGLYSKKGQKKDELFRQQKTINEIQNTIDKEKNDLFYTYNKYEYVNNIFSLKQSLINAEQELRELDELKAQLKWQKEVFNTDSEILRYEAEKLHGLKKEIEGYGVDINAVPEIYKLRNKIDSVNEIIDELKNKINVITSNYMVKFRSKPGVAELENKIKALTEQLNKQKSLCESYDIAIQMLNKTEKELRQNFAPKLNEIVKDIFSSLSDEKYDDAVVSKDFDINVRQKDGDILNWQYLSNGTVDQVYFALRVALSQLMEENNETLPLILDDVFLQYDDERATTAIKFLDEHSKNCQIILFTCRKTFYDIYNKIRTEKSKTK
ncbi:MAG: AAA family ATPase [Clostridia bacterium]|nr:AAA family ATPase [Clostridia bacterium]